MPQLGQFDDLRAEATRPVAATLLVCAELLGVPLPTITAAAGRVEPYEHADGSPRWSVRGVERELGRARATPEERRRQRRAAERRQRGGE